MAEWGNCSGALPPVADDQSVTTDEDVATDITLTGTAEDEANLTFEIVRLPSDGTLSGTPPYVNYAPDADYNGLDSFDFVLHDGTATSNVATVSITVMGVNDPPSANDQSVTTTKNTPVAITLSGDDVDGDTLTFAVLSGPSHGALTGTGDTRTYTPATDYAGSDAFTCLVSDGNGGSATTTVSITVKKGKGGSGQGGGGQGKPPKGKK